MFPKPILSVLFLFALAAGAQQPAPPPASAPPAKPAHPHPVSAHRREQAQHFFMRGAQEMDRDQPRQALDDFQRAAQLDPGDQRFAVSMGVARQRLAVDLVRQAERESSQGQMDKAIGDVQEAYRLAPEDPVVDEHVRSFAQAAAAHRAALPAGTVTAGPPVQLQPIAGLRSFHLRTNEGTLIQQVCSAYGIHPTLDTSVESKIVPFNIDNVDFVHAERALALATNTFFVPLDPVRVLVARDSPENRNKFERLALETFPLDGMPPDEAMQMVNLAREEFGAKTAFSSTGQDSITVRAPVEDLAAFKSTLDGLIQGRDQIELDVVMYEVDRTNSNDIGAILPTQTTLFNVYSEANQILQQNASLVQEIISSGLAQPGQWAQILAILVASGEVSSSILSNPFVTFGGGLTMTGISTAGGTASMQLNSSSVHAIDQLQLRLGDKQEGTLKVGERYPIETSSFSNPESSALSVAGISSSGLSSTLQNLGISASELAASAEVVPQIQYQDIGLTLTVTPRVEGPKGVSLQFDLKLTSIAGASSIQSLPVLDNREYKTITSLNLGESAVLVSALTRQQATAISGLPGLDEIPGFADATNRNSSLNYSELAIVVTPHIVRLTHPESAERMMVLPPSSIH